MQREVHTASFVNITPDAEKQMAYCARVSNPNNQGNHETAPRLLRYCIKHKHWSIFETASMQVEVNTTRAIAAQVLRHRSFSFQEFSQRYSSVDQLGAFGVPHLRSQDLKNKQASHDNLDPEFVALTEKQILTHYNSAIDLYEHLLAKGVAKECARSILPLGTPTRLYMSGSIRSWIHYIQIRAGIETQLEHRMIAESIKQIFAEQLPNVYEAAFT
jgi:thymidylate synthase (FAD)